MKWDSLKKVADRVMLFDDGLMVEENTPNEFFDNPKNDRTKLF
jgi:ABC-type polar amino acid transport system ATPase subunit